MQALIATDRSPLLFKTKAAQRKHYQSTYGTVVDRNSKIDASVFNLDPTQCKRGVVLAKIEGSICHDCYAMKAYRMYPSVRESQGGNQDLWESMGGHEIHDWAEGIAWQIQEISDRKARGGKAGAGLHRWLAAGDVPDLSFLLAVIKVAILTPNIQHWLPTREYKMVEQLQKVATIPSNLVIRVSANMVDKQAPKRFAQTSTAHKETPAVGRSCPASVKGSCATHDCTSCWKTEVANVSYPFH